MSPYYILGGYGQTHTARGVAKELIERSLGGWIPGRSRQNRELSVQVISNVSRAFLPFRRAAVYHNMSWVVRLGQRVGGLVGIGKLPQLPGIDKSKLALR